MKSFEIIKSIEQISESFCITNFNGMKKPHQHFATQIALDIYPIFYDILEKKGFTNRISLVIRSNGGPIETPLPIINLLREYCNELIVYVPENAHSAATLIAIGGDKIIMSPYGSLSPFDPQMNIGDKTKTVKNFSIEDVRGYYLLLDDLNLSKHDKVKALELIADDIEPIKLGQIRRTGALINLIANKIIPNTTSIFAKIKKRKIINQLTKGIPSHSYLIGRKEAKMMGLPIINEKDEEHSALINLMTEYKKMVVEHGDLIIDIPEGSNTVTKKFNRAYIETIDDTYSFITEYVFHRNEKIDQVKSGWEKTR